MNPRLNRRARPYEIVLDEIMHAVDHALGYPVDPLRETCREHYAVASGSVLCDAMRASPCFRETPRAVRHGRVSPSGLAYFTVTDFGRRALANALADAEGPRA